MIYGFLCTELISGCSILFTINTVRTMSLMRTAAECGGRRVRDLLCLCVCGHRQGLRQTWSGVDIEAGLQAKETELTVRCNRAEAVKFLNK